MLTTSPTGVAVPGAGTAGQNFNVTGTAPNATGGGQRSASAQAAPTLVVDSPAPGATVSLPFAITGHTYPPGATVAFVNDATGNGLGTPVVSDGVTGAFSFTATSTGA